MQIFLNHNDRFHAQKHSKKDRFHAQKHYQGECTGGLSRMSWSGVLEFRVLWGLDDTITCGPWVKLLSFQGLTTGIQGIHLTDCHFVKAFFYFRRLNPQSSQTNHSLLTPLQP